MNYKVVVVAGVLFFQTILPANPQNWLEITLADLPGFGIFSVSSSLNSADGDYINGKFGGKNLFDKNPATTWAEGKEDAGLNEILYMVIPGDCRTVNLYNGYAKDVSLFAKNNRVKKVAFSCLIGVNPEGYVSENYIVYKAFSFGDSVIFNLRDTLGVQTLRFPFDMQRVKENKQRVLERFKKDFNLNEGRVDLILKITILDVYKGKKWDDTCISELFFNHTFIHNPVDEKYKRVDSIYLNVDENAILFDSADKRGIELIRDSLSVFQIMDNSKDNEWLAVSRMPAAAGEGRIESENLLFNTHLSREVSDEIGKVTGSDIYGPYFFDYKSGELYLEYYRAGEDESALLELK